jgi:hypothetical protein
MTVPLTATAGGPRSHGEEVSTLWFLLWKIVHGDSMCEENDGRAPARG